jgi:hypothetical protein
MRPYLPVIYLSLLVLPFLTACQPAPQQAQEPDATEKAAADAKLNEMLSAKQRRAAFAEEQRAKEAERQARLEAEAARPHYSAYRLQAAAKPHNWADIVVPDLNVHAVFNSNWTPDHINYRIALLGEKRAIDTFLHQHQSYSVNLVDQAANQIIKFDVAPDSFEWAPPNFNGGIPTMQMTGTVDCDLPVYEQAVQWNLTWEN